MPELGEPVPLRRVGHKGADLIAPGNTLASFDAALACGVDMIEFDVLPERGSQRLILAHDYRAAARGAPPTLEEGLAHFAGDAYEDVDLDVDLKLPGYEERVVEALRSFGLIDRSLVSSQYRESLAIVRSLEPRLRLGWSVPRARRDYTGSPLTALPARVALVAYRWALPRRAAAVRRAGGDLYVWTVDDLEAIRRFGDLGVTGVITNDPRLFGGLAEA